MAGPRCSWEWDVPSSWAGVGPSVYRTCPPGAPGSPGAPGHLAHLVTWSSSSPSSPGSPGAPGTPGSPSSPSSPGHLVTWSPSSPGSPGSPGAPGAPGAPGVRDCFPFPLTQPRPCLGETWAQGGRSGPERMPESAEARTSSTPHVPALGSHAPLSWSTPL